MNKQLPDITTHFSEWYNEIVYQAELADQAPVRGCMVIMPYGYALWENIQKILDKKIKDTGHVNAGFPLLIPQSFLQREAQHVEGFAPELAVVTHAGGKELEEPLVVRPTSETIIHYMFARWMKSWRDLPLKVNQWCTVVRWEMRTRPFIRTTEIWWQEGHTAHEKEQEAHEEAHLMLREYTDLLENYLAVPVVPARKPDSERFAGADITLTMEGLMPDGKALQMGTSHVISQNFAKAFGMQYQDRTGQLTYPFLTSWGTTTRMIGALVMMHGDQKGLILPPKVAPFQVVIVPIIIGKHDPEEIYSACEKVAQSLQNFRVKIDKDDNKTPGAKLYHWELKGVPLRIEIGPRDVANKTVTLSDRLNGIKETIAVETITTTVEKRLDELHNQLLQRARERRAAMWYKIATFKEFMPLLENKGGFYQTGWCKGDECEKEFKAAKATIRCVLNEQTFSQCAVCGNQSDHDVLVAKAY